MSVHPQEGDSACRTGLKIAFAAEHTLFRQAVAALLRLQPDVVEVSEIDRLDDVAAGLAAADVDLGLIDLEMGGDVETEILRLSTDATLIALTGGSSPEAGLQAVRNGARGVVLKHSPLTTLMDCIHSVVQGDVWLPPPLQSQLTSTFRQNEREPLSQRERDVVRCVASGLRNAEVARKLFISDATVKTHLNHIFHKLGVRDRVQLTLYATRSGMIEMPEAYPPPMPTARPSTAL